jgi:FkbM family methyltransferase
MSKLMKKSPLRFAKRWLVRNHDRIRCLIPDRYFAFSVPGGKIYLNIKESSMMFERSLGLYEPEKTKAVQDLLRPTETFIDVGSNKGDFALLASKIVGREGRVICVEPEPTNFGWIQRSIELNGYKNIQLSNVALSDHGGESLVYLGSKSGFNTQLSGAPERDQGSIKVRTRTLDSLLPELGAGPVNVLKIDVEGAELQVLKGATETIKNNPQILVLLDIHTFLGVDPVEVFDCLSSLGLTACRTCPPYNIPAIPQKGIYDVVARRL